LPQPWKDKTMPATSNDPHETTGSTGARSSTGDDRHDRDTDYERGVERGRTERHTTTGGRGTDERRREAYGGLNIGASFFGWLVAVGLTILLTGILSAIAAAVGAESGLNITPRDARTEAGTIGLTSGIVLLVVLMIGYYAGGYVAGRMSRFDGVKQGIGVWVIGLVVTIIVAIIAAVASSEYDVFKYIPTIPIPTDTLTTSGIIALVVVLLGTLLAAIIGGKIGQRYHAKVDRIS
jgi:hypothetical protein